MEVIINGETRITSDGLSLAQLVDELGLSGKRIAVELNREIAPHGHYGEIALHNGDRLEIVHAIGG
ncbi:MAG: sulfur carrier protein ThiS, partial [Methylococcaceae bacterium]|nr:sulfur carrier protein ThiS [Methylococcaceae bacterium]